MKGFFRSKVVMTIAAFIMIAAAVVIPLSGNIFHSHAQSPLVAFAKSATPTVAPGGTINYTLTLTNITPSGSGNLHDIHLNDTPPAQTSGTFTAPTFTITPPGSATVDCTLSTTTSILCAVDDFAPGSVVTVSFSTTASSTATGTITNTATATTFSGNINETATANTVVTGAGTTITIITKSGCGSKTPISGILLGSETVTITVIYETTDPSDTGEQNEPLKIFDTATKTPEVIVIPEGKTSITRTFTFLGTSEGGEQLFACITGPGKTADEKATIIVKITRTPDQELQRFENLEIGCVLPFLKLGDQIEFVRLISEGKIAEAFKSLIPFIGLPDTIKACKSLLCLTGVIGQFGIIQVGFCREQVEDVGGIAR